MTLTLRDLLHERVGIRGVLGAIALGTVSSRLLDTVWVRIVAGRPAHAEQWVTSKPNVPKTLVDERTHRAQFSPAELSARAVDQADSAPSAE